MENEVKQTTPAGPIPAVPFEVYSEMFKDFFHMKRENGIIEVRAHTNDGPALWTFGMHRAMGQMYRFVGADPENEVMILTATGDKWFSPSLKFIDEGMKKQYQEYNEEDMQKKTKAYAESTYNEWYTDGRQLHEGIINDIRIPTIAAINGPGGHTSFGLFCDITICTPDAVFQDYHFSQGLPCGEGQYLAMQSLIGIKRANYCSIMGEYLDAQTALELGVVNEVIPREKIYDRAWEIAERYMNRSRMARRATSEIMKRKWRDIFNQDYHMEYFLQCWTGAVDGIPKHDAEKIAKFNTEYTEDNHFMMKGKEEYKPNFTHEVP